MKYLKLLYIQVLIAILLGVLAGIFFPGLAPAGKIISEKFIDLIKMVIVPIIFITIVLGIAGAGDMKKVGRVGGKGLLYFEIVTTFALLIGVAVAYLIKPGAGVDINTVQMNDKAASYIQKGGSLNWVDFFTHIIPSNVFKAFAEGDILQVLLFSILFGIALTRLGSVGHSIIINFEKYGKVMFGVMRMVMKLAPIGAFGGMAYTIGTFGSDVLISLGRLMLTFYITVFLFIAVVLNVIARFYGFSLMKLLRYIKEEIFIAVGASSSEPVLPNIMQKLEAAGCDKNVVGLIIPTGYSFNLDGTTIYLSMCTIFLAQASNVQLSTGELLAIIGILMLTSKGAAGVTGSGFIVLASTLAAVQVIPTIGLALLIGIDRFMSEARTVTNLVGNTVAAVVIAKSEKAINTEQYRQVVEHRIYVQQKDQLVEKEIDL
jgi:aerobic C4-dicarboxylate transport protein